MSRRPRSSSSSTDTTGVVDRDLSLIELLELYGFDRSCRVKLLRHQDRNYNVADLLRRDWFESYQQFQSKPVFEGLEFIVSFAGMEGTKARFLGVYRVLGQVPRKERRVPTGCPYTEWLKREFCYSLEKQPGYEVLENRLVIDWGRATLAWHQKLKDKPVLEILPKGQLLPLFDDYLGFSLTHAELQYLFRHVDANRSWKARLSAVAGIYLILATSTGRQYIGSASGTEGIWGRWASYAANGHGGNAQLRALIENDSAYPEGFTYSILQILPRTAAWAEVLQWENRYKEKLGSLATGLNSN